MAENQIQQKALGLSYFSVGYNVVECLVSIYIGTLTGSISLVGFGLDSFIESLSGGVLIWRFNKSSTISESHDDPTEQRAIRLIAYTFFVIGGYTLFESLRRLYLQEGPTQNLPNLVIAVISIIVMLGLYYQKNILGRSNHIRSLVADSRQTLACIYMSVALIVGSLLNIFFHIWWADALAGVIISVLLLKEGYTTYKEKNLCEH